MCITNRMTECCINAQVHTVLNTKIITLKKTFFFTQLTLSTQSDRMAKYI